MAGQASGGQILTPYSNVTAVAGVGGDKWGAGGGAIAAVGGGAVDQTGYVKPILATLSRAETAANYMTQSGQITSNPSGVPNSAIIQTLVHLQNDFSDNALSPLTWTAGGTNGTASISNSQFEFGTSSLFLSGTNCFISTPAPGIDITQNSIFTLDFWCYPSTTTINQIVAAGLVCPCDFSGNLLTGFRVNLQGGGPTQANVQGFGSGGGWQFLNQSTSNNVTPNAWNHIAIIRNGNTVSIGLNGTITATSGVSGNATAVGGATSAFIGASSNSGGQSTGFKGGFIQEFRVTYGAALYPTGNGATYTVPSVPSGNPGLITVAVPPPQELSMLKQMSSGAVNGQTTDNSFVQGNFNSG